MNASLIRRLVPERYRPIGYLTHLVRQRTGCRVRLGPFAGMSYVSNSIGSAYVPKLLGIYERELTQVMEEACARQPRLIVDIGAAEGYYAVGLALRNPQATVIAFEAEERGRTALQQMAVLNGAANRLEIGGRCDPAGLQSALAEHKSLSEKPSPPPCRADAPRRLVEERAGERRPFSQAALVICDVEGYEEHLLDPIVVPELKSATILAEMHDFIHPGITEEIQRRFAATHRCERIWQEPRTRKDFPFQTIGTALLPGSYLDWVVSEWRPVRMSWLRLEPHD